MPLPPPPPPPADEDKTWVGTTTSIKYRIHKGWVGVNATPPVWAEVYSLWWERADRFGNLRFLFIHPLGPSASWQTFLRDLFVLVP